MFNSLENLKIIMEKKPGVINLDELGIINQNKEPRYLEEIHINRQHLDSTIISPTP